MASSTNLYNTFGNELKYRISQGTLEAYLENATIKFPLPEASSTILGELAPIDSVNPQELDAVRGELERIGFGQANARAMAAVLIQVAKSQGVSPLTYFDLNAASLKLAIDTYETINLLRPPGNRIGLTSAKDNQKSRASSLIQP
jgi:hypothetical protein